MAYKYFCNDPLEERINYEYSVYIVKNFLMNGSIRKIQIKNKIHTFNLDVIYNEKFDINCRSIITKELINDLKSKIKYKDRFKIYIKIYQLDHKDLNLLNVFIQL